MKHCRKDPAEPNCFAEFRRQYPDADWEDDFRNLVDERPCYKEILGKLREDQWGLCAYCEIRLEPRYHERVEHFHPKSDMSSAKNWAFDWHNLWLVCKGVRRFAGQSDKRLT